MSIIADNPVTDNPTAYLNRDLKILLFIIVAVIEAFILHIYFFDPMIKKMKAKNEKGMTGDVKNELEYYDYIQWTAANGYEVHFLKSSPDNDDTYE